MFTPKRRLSPFNPLSYPLWLKTGIAISAAIFVLLMLGLLVWRAGTNELSLLSARSYLSETASRQLAAVTRAFERAAENLERFASEPTVERYVLSLLLGDVSTSTDVGVIDIQPRDVASRMDEILLNPATSLFDNVRLLDRHGQVIVQAGLPATGVSLVNQADTPAYQAALAVSDDPHMVAVVSDRGFAVLEFTRPIVWRDGTAIGYLVAQVNNARAIYSNIRFTAPASEPYRTISFLVDAEDVLFTPIETRDFALLSIESLGARRALSGQSGIDVYRIENGAGAEVIGYYAPVPGIPLVLVAQIDYASAASGLENFIPLRGFIAAVAVFGVIIVATIALTQLIVPPLARLRRAALGVIGGDYETPIPDVHRGDEVGATAEAFMEMRGRIKDVVNELESRVALRTRDIQATQEISRYAATQRDLSVLLNEVVELIIKRFPVIYHAQIFLVDDDGMYAVVRASTGEVGKRLLERGHRLAVGSVSVIGQVTDHGRYILAKDTAASQVHRRNEFLPNTRSELAIPLQVGNRIIGALDVQSIQSDAFPDDLIRVLETMADNIAIAIENARLYEEALRRVRQIEEGNREATRTAWQEYLRDQRALSISREAGVNVGSDDTISELRRRATASGEVLVGELTVRNTYPVAVPIQLRGQTLGAVEWELPANDFSRDKLELARELADRLALSLDNARLFQESRRATERERLVNMIASRLTAQTSIDQILQTAVREVGQALRAPQVTIRLRSGSENQITGEVTPTNDDKFE